MKFIENKSDKEILEAYAMVLTNLKDLIQEEVVSMVTNKTHILYAIPGRIKGTVVAEGLVNQEISAIPELTNCIKSGEQKIGLVDSNRYGFPFLLIANAVKNSRGEIIGSVGIGRV